MGETLAFDFREFSGAIMRHRMKRVRVVTVRMRGRTTVRQEPLGLRTCAEEIGISAPTLSRIERGMDPDINTFAKVCAWLKVNPNKFFKPTSHA